MKVFISGASSGIGKAIAERYASLGADLFLISRTEDALIEISDELSEKYQVKCRFDLCDVTSIEQVNESVEKCKESIGIPDIVILNAGISIPDDFREISTENIRKIYDVNVFGVLNIMEIFVPLFLKTASAKIAVISSLADARGIAFSAGYTSSKAAISKLCEAARIQLKGTGIDIITIRPGFVRTKLVENFKGKMPFIISSEKAAKIIVKKIQKNKKIISFPKVPAIFSYIMSRISNKLYEYAAHLWTKER